MPNRTDAAGIITAQLKLNRTPLNLQGPRVSLHSRFNRIRLADGAGFPIGDSAIGGAPVSVLVFAAFNPPAHPTWADVSPILTEYTQFYPGMKDRLDISNEQLVTGSFRDEMIKRMGADPWDPAFMPVTRDLTPSRVGMVVNFLRQSGGALTGDV